MHPIETPWQTVTSHACKLGESPFWDPHEQMLYWLDISGKQILRANIYMGTVDVWDMPSEPGCMAPATSGGLVLALRDGVYRARNWGGQLDHIATLNYDPGCHRANDGKCDAYGRFWIGTIDETRVQKNAALYCLDGRITGEAGTPRISCKIAPRAGMTTANGLAWSADNRTMYWADTPSHTVWAWDFDIVTGAMTGQRVFASFAPKPAGWQTEPDDVTNGGYGGRPDGAAVDSQGNYWVAMYEGQRLCQFAPDGTLLAQIHVPLQCPTMPCFGGEDLKTLYLTSATHANSKVEQTAFAQAGQVLSMRVNVAGLAVNFFAD